MAEGAGDASGGATGVKPGALTALLQEVAATPEKREEEPLSLPPGTVIGRFEIIRELGRGGFGVVYEAKDRDLGRQVAVKVVRPGRITEEEGKVSREAEAIARLVHPNLITLHEVGRSEHGPFLVFELLRGKTLDLRIEEGPLPVQEAVHIATEVARGLAHAHAEGVIHRDLKPANVFVTNKGQVKVLDFGMAHAFGRRRLSGGTPAYMAPEQWEDDPEDERTDVFALGVMLYRMLTGEYPFPEGKGKWSAEPATLRKLDVPGAPELADLVEKMLDRTPKGRPRDGAAVLAALTPIEDRLRAKPADGTPPVHAKRRKATFGDLLAELKRRHVFRVMVGYGIFSFAVLQVTEPIMHGAGLPDWVLTVVLVALVMGFPVAVILAWVYDLTAQGVKRTPSSTDPGAPRFGRSRFLLPVAVSVAVLAIATAGAGGWYAWKHGHGSRSVQAAGESQSIAVLPFKDLSPNHDQDYFSDGISEEILSALSGVKGLRVPGRVSSFYFKGKNVEPEEIARKLGVAHLLEGSVRRSGDKLRISAEVVRASDGERIWSKSFDRQASDVFAVQDEIARTVADALRLKLVPGEDLEGRWTRTDNPEAYNQLLLGRDFMRRGTPEDFRRALDAFERALALDPGYAAAWAGVVDSAMVIVSDIDPGESGLRAKALAAADKAVALAPGHPNGYRHRAALRAFLLFDWPGAVADLDRVLALQPDDAISRWNRAALLGSPGPLASQVPRFQKAAESDPLDASAWLTLGEAYIIEGDLLHARQVLGRALEIAPGNTGATASMCISLIADGRPDEALTLAVQSRLDPLRLWCTALAQSDLGNIGESNVALEALVARYAKTGAAQVAEVYAWRGDRDRAFDWLDRAVAQRDVGIVKARYNPLYRKLHDDPRWKEFLARLTVAGSSGQPPTRPAEAAPATPSIAVLPFADMSPKHDQEYFADGVAEEILNGLAQVQGLKVIGRTSSFSFKGKSDDIKTIGQKLGVANVLEGSLRKDGNGIRVTAKLIRVADGTQLWSERYDRKLAGIFKVQDEIAEAVVGALKVKLLPGNRAGPGATRVFDPEAFRLFLLGRSLVLQRTEESNRRAIATLDAAIAIDPGMGQAHAWLASAAWNVSLSTSGEERRELLRRQRAEADRAVALAPTLSTAYAVRAFARMAHGWDWEGARRDIDKAMELDPHDPAALDVKANLESALGRFPEALELRRKAVELDPLNEEVTLNLGWDELAVGDMAGVRRMARRALEIHPESDMARALPAHADLWEGKAAEALAGFEQIRAEGKMPGLPGAAAAAFTLGKMEQSDTALAELEQQRDDLPFLVASVHAWRGDKDGAFRLLDQAYRERDVRLLLIKSWPLLRPIRDDPRYNALLKKMNLPVN